jgi:hypothetical protein
MNPLISPATNHYLLEVSLEDLHQESKAWLSEINLWRIELAFYQKLLEKVSVKLTSVEEKQKIDHFQHLIIYYRGEVLDQFEKDIRKHEKQLQNMIQQKAPFNEQLYREVHKKHEDQISAFDKNFKQYRQDLYAFAENYL